MGGLYPAQNFTKRPQPHDLSLTVDREDSTPPRAINDALQLPKRFWKRKVSREGAPRGLVDGSTGFHSGESQNPVTLLGRMREPEF